MNSKFEVSVKIVVVILISLFAFSIVFAGCAEKTTSVETTKTLDTSESEDSSQGDNFAFESKGVKIVMHEPAAAIISQLGKETAYFEAESCAFEGIDKTYSYPGFDLMTYPTDDKDFVSAVILRDDSVTTPEGLYIGADESEIEALQGTGYKSDKPGVYVYEKAKSKLQIIVKDGSVMSIEYLAITD